MSQVKANEKNGNYTGTQNTFEQNPYCQESARPWWGNLSVGYLCRRRQNQRQSCTDRQLLKVVKAFEEKGWKHRKNPNQYRKVPTGRADLEKIYALWGHLQDLGAVRSTNLVDLDKWVCRMTKGKRSSAQFLEESWAQRIIECLKKWIEREECKGGCREWV